MSKEKVRFSKFQKRVNDEPEPDDFLKSNYISFLENIYDEVLRARTHPKNLEPWSYF